MERDEEISTGDYRFLALLVRQRINRLKNREAKKAVTKEHVESNKWRLAQWRRLEKLLLLRSRT